MNDSMVYILFAFCSLCVAYGIYKICLSRFGNPHSRTPRAPQRKTGEKDHANMMMKSLATKINGVLPIAKSDNDEYRMQLARAGVKLDPQTYRGITLMVIAGFALLGIMFSFSDDSLLMKIIIIGVAVALGVIVPRLLLAQMAKQRREAITAELPNGLEMLAAVVATGQPIESGFRIVSNASAGPLSEEFRQVDTEINLTGKSRSEAMRSLAERCQLPTVSIFCSAIIQATEQGAPISRTLRGQASIARKDSRAKLEEKANKIPVKQKIPLVVFFVVAMMILVLAPKVAQVMSMLATMVS